MRLVTATITLSLLAGFNDQRVHAVPTGTAPELEAQLAQIGDAHVRAALEGLAAEVTSVKAANSALQKRVGQLEAGQETAPPPPGGSANSSAPRRGLQRVDHTKAVICHVRRMTTRRGAAVTAGDLADLGMTGRRRNAEAPDEMCPLADMDTRLELVTRGCCDGAAGNCTSGIPQACDEQCAMVLVPFWEECGRAVRGRYEKATVRRISEAVDQCESGVRGESLAVQLGLSCSDAELEMEECVPACYEGLHGDLLLAEIDGEDSKYSCEKHHGLYSWIASASNGGYLGRDVLAFLSSLLSGASGVYICTLVVDAGILGDVAIQLGMSVRIQGDRFASSTPVWGSGGFHVAQEASLSLSHVAFDTGAKIVVAEQGSLTLINMRIHSEQLDFTPGVGGTLALTNVSFAGSSFGEGDPCCRTSAEACGDDWIGAVHRPAGAVAAGHIDYLFPTGTYPSNTNCRWLIDCAGGTLQMAAESWDTKPGDQIKLFTIDQTNASDVREVDLVAEMRQLRLDQAQAYQFLAPPDRKIVLTFTTDSDRGGHGFGMRYSCNTFQRPNSSRPAVYTDFLDTPVTQSYTIDTDGHSLVSNTPGAVDSQCFMPYTMLDDPWRTYKPFDWTDDHLVESCPVMAAFISDHCAGAASLNDCNFKVNIYGMAFRMEVQNICQEWGHPARMPVWSPRTGPTGRVTGTPDNDCYGFSLQSNEFWMTMSQFCGEVQEDAGRRQPMQCDGTDHLPSRGSDMDVTTYSQRSFGNEWFRLAGGGDALPVRPPNIGSCATNHPGWLSGWDPVDGPPGSGVKRAGILPFTEEGRRPATVCFSGFGHACQDFVEAHTVNCGSFTLYQLPDVPACPLGYCTSPGPTGLDPCNGGVRLTDPSGTISFTDYNVWSFCRWTISCGDSGRVGLTMNTFDTELQYDFLEVFDGVHGEDYATLASGDHADKISGPRTAYNWAQRSMASTGSALRLEFTSDGSVGGDGFELEWTCGLPAQDSDWGTDCAGTWSECTPACESASERIWTSEAGQVRYGAICPGATDCQDGCQLVCDFEPGLPHAPTQRIGIGTTTSKEACMALAREMEPTANGASFHLVTGECSANLNMRQIVEEGHARWRSCLLGFRTDGKVLSARSCYELGWSPGAGSAAVCAESELDHDGSAALESAAQCHGGDSSTTNGFDHARRICEDVGARLCTAAELNAHEAQGTGCTGHDQSLTWSSTSCQIYSGCAFAPGAASGGETGYVASAETPEECVQHVLDEMPTANGVSYLTPCNDAPRGYPGGSGTYCCWAQLGMTGRLGAQGMGDAEADAAVIEYLGRDRQMFSCQFEHRSDGMQAVRGDGQGGAADSQCQRNLDLSLAVRCCADVRPDDELSGHVQTPEPQTYLGCFRDNVWTRRDLSHSAGSVTGTTDAALVFEQCSTLCNGYTYFGLQYVDECFCGNSFGSLGVSTNCGAASNSSNGNCANGARGCGNCNAVYLNTVDPDGGDPLIVGMERTVTITTTTGSLANSQSNSPITVTLYGSLGHAGPMELPDRMRRGQMQIFPLQIGDIGDLSSVRFFNAGNDGWLLLSITVQDGDRAPVTIRSNNEAGHRHDGRWLDGDGDTHEHNFVIPTGGEHGSSGNGGGPGASGGGH